jgi:hypothetical protein
MGYYKNSTDARTAAKRYNAAKRRQEQLLGFDASRLIRLETVSETERYSMAQDADRLTEYNKAVNAWQNSVAAQLRATIASRSLRIARELQPKAYTDNYGIINRLGFSFPRHGIYIHKGAGRGQGGYIGSSWTQLKTINGIEISTGIVKHTNINSINGKQGTGNRRAFEWFDPVIKNRLSELADIVTQYFDSMLIDATRIFINK